MEVLYLNNSGIKKKCGVYQYGLRLYNILKETKNINYIYDEVNDYNDYMKILSKSEYNNIKAIFYNYHYGTMSWLNENNIQTKILNVGIEHDTYVNNIFNITVYADPTFKEKKNKYNMPPPLFENIEEKLQNHKITNDKLKHFIEYKENNIPIIGSFGFGLHRKRFDKIVEIVNSNYDKAIIKLIITRADTMRYDEDVIYKCIEKNIKPNIKLMFYHDFVDEDTILYFLNSNTINLFAHENDNNAGLCSGVDYALSVKTPLGITNTSWFRHIYHDDICIEKNKLDYIIQKSPIICDNLRKLYCHNNYRKKIKDIITGYYKIR